MGGAVLTTDRVAGAALVLVALLALADSLHGRSVEPLALISADPTILVVRAESPWKTAKEFIDDARRRPGQITFSSSGIYGTLHMAMELLSQAGRHHASPRAVQRRGAGPDGDPGRTRGGPGLRPGGGAAPHQGREAARPGRVG